MSKIIIHCLRSLPPARHGRNGGATAWREDIAGAKPTAGKLRRMYAGAQTRWKSKGKLRLCTAAPEKAVVQGEFNYLLNPQHPDFKLIKISTPERFSFDMRMWKQD
jgi:hypothetical protein